MKKLLLLIACAAMFVGCQKEGPRTTQTIFLHLENNEGKLITLNVENTGVFFVEDTGNEIDYKKSNPTSNGGKLTYTDGSMSPRAKIFDSGKAVYTFENVPNGKYILWVHYFAYSTGVKSSKMLTVNESSHLSIEKKRFKGSSGYEEW